MLRLYDRNEGQYVSFGELMALVRSHRRPDGMAQPLLFWGSAGIGKAQPLHSLVLTPAGWRAMGDLEVGDEVVDPTGGIARVVGVFPQGVRDIYRVTLADDEEAECDLEHLWQVRSVRLEETPWEVITLRAILERTRAGERFEIPRYIGDEGRSGLATLPRARTTQVGALEQSSYTGVPWSGETALLERVSPVGRDEARCIALDSQAQLYVTDDGVVTHNTARVRHFADELGLAMKIYLPAQDNTGADIVGERMIDERTGKTVRVLPVWLPDAERDGPEGVLFVDEINRAPKSVRDGLLELMGDGTIMQVGYTMPAGWSIVAAANPADLGHDVYDIDDAMVDRFLHVAPGYDAAVWAAWAKEQQTLHPSVIDYALSNPGDVAAGEVGFPVELQDRIKPTPRAWANLGFLIDDQTDEALLRVVALGMLGREAGDRFVQSWLAWHQGRRPLRFEQVLKREEYEPILSSWRSSPEAVPLIEASNEHIIAGLMGREPSEDVALLVARYLAMIPEAQRTQFFQSADRTIQPWLELLEAGVKRWQSRGGSA